MLLFLLSLYMLQYNMYTNRKPGDEMQLKDDRGIQFHTPHSK